MQTPYEKATAITREKLNEWFHTDHLRCECGSDDGGHPLADLDCLAPYFAVLLEQAYLRGQRDGRESFDGPMALDVPAMDEIVRQVLGGYNDLRDT